MIFTIDDDTSLAMLRRRSLPAGTTKLELGGPFADQEIEKRLNSSFFACGCQEGATAVFAALMVSTIGAIATGLSGAFAWWWIVAYAFGAALLGKGIGLAIAWVRLIRVRRELAAINVRELHPESQ
ncbi:hypothetical protein I6E52_10670 [Salinibacterium sp. NG253]|uniref:hypothetical protein n=1 Tax=Salinibacterium sp. NG253 TaxID=2792039 RepID=UPI0018CF8AC3|nr:hypothetical protein [Salinibacterium sp. NG253]MBH0117306.1 hypothetical protein [Salinibacterium sp. NG253]